MSPLFSVRAPATSANLGSGFDTIGMALSLYNIFDVMELREHGIYEGDVIGEGAKELTDHSKNMVVTSYETACRAFGAKNFPGFFLRSNNVIPLKRGLGSSAGAVVAGVLLADAICGLGRPEEELLKVMVQIEGHPDNVAPCYLGGMVVGCWDGESLRYIKLPSLPAEVHVVVGVPNVHVSTHAAREALPEQVDFKDAVFNLGRAALLAAAWATGQWSELGWGMDDRIHQPYRTKLFPGGDVIMDRVRTHPECIGAAISGSGPSVLALVKGSPRRVAETMCATFSEYDVRSQFFVLDGNASGAVVRKDGRYNIPRSVSA